MGTNGHFINSTWMKYICCLLYTSPSPRDGLLSIRRQASDVYKRQAMYLKSNGLPDRLAGVLGNGYKWAFHKFYMDEVYLLSLIHISEPTRRTPIYSSAGVRCV